MASETDGETNACVFLWKIENISHCWLKKGDQMKSPTFIADALQGTKWSLSLVPIGNLWENDIELRLYREEECNGPDQIDVNYKLALLHKDGSFLKGRNSNEIYNKGHLGLALRVERKKIFFTDRDAFLHDDTLSVQCTIWKQGETSIKIKESFVRTVWNVKRRRFALNMVKFSSQDRLRYRLKDALMDFDFALKEGLDFEEKIFLNLIAFDKSVKYILFKISVVNSERKEEPFGNIEYFESDLKKGILSRLLSTRMLTEKKNRYLENDTLSLHFEYLFSTGTISDEHCSNGITSSNVTNVTTRKRNEYFIVKAKYPHSPVLENDLKSLYNDGSFSDVELRTSTKTFPAHKLILIARSPVFKKMFSNDMKENKSGHVNIDDLEDDTVHRMLLYMYTDSLEGLQFENACKLFVAADKYEILALKSLCASFLKEHLCQNNACDILALADIHKDDDLKHAAQHYILKHDEIFGLLEWKRFMSTNVQLAAEVMYCKIYPG